MGTRPYFQDSVVSLLKQPAVSTMSTGYLLRDLCVFYSRADACGGQRRVSAGFPEVGRTEFRATQMDSGNWIQVLSESSKYSQPVGFCLRMVPLHLLIAVQVENSSPCDYGGNLIVPTAYLTDFILHNNLK